MQPEVFEGRAGTYFESQSPDLNSAELHFPLAEGQNKQKHPTAEGGCSKRLREAEQRRKPHSSAIIIIFRLLALNSCIESIKKMIILFAVMQISLIISVLSKMRVLHINEL